MPTPQADEFAPYADLIPEGCVALAGLRVIKAIDEGGDPCMFFKIDGGDMAIDFSGNLMTIVHLMQHRTSMKDVDDNG
jgi:hypothetical protein